MIACTMAGSSWALVAHACNSNYLGGRILSKKERKKEGLGCRLEFANYRIKL
jgi:hypothetical protein